MHNQSRQFDLSLETKWVTQDGYFRLFTTLLGIQVVDCWKVSDEREQTIYDFADFLASDIISDANEVMKEEEDDDRTFLPTNVSLSADGNTTPSSLSSEKQYTHTMEKVKTQLRCLWCSRVNLLHRKTYLRCKECGGGFCVNGCWSHHVAYGGIPAKPARGTKKVV